MSQHLDAKTVQNNRWFFLSNCQTCLFKDWKPHEHLVVIGEAKSYDFWFYADNDACQEFRKQFYNLVSLVSEI